MNKSILITALSLVIVFSGFAQTRDLKGGKYKNAKPAVKYKGNSSILIHEDPNQFQGPEFKNFKSTNYEMEIKEPNKIQMPENLVVSTEQKILNTEAPKEKIIYRRVDADGMKGKNSKGLKGPAYKNYKP